MDPPETPISSGRGSSGTGEPKPPISAQPPKDYAPLICRVVRAARVLAAGLGFPVGPPSVLNPQPPIVLEAVYEGDTMCHLGMSGHRTSTERLPRAL